MFTYNLKCTNNAHIMRGNQHTCINTMEYTKNHIVVLTCKYLMLSHVLVNNFIGDLEKYEI